MCVHMGLCVSVCVSLGANVFVSECVRPHG